MSLLLLSGHNSLQNVRYFPSIDATPFPQQYVNIPANFQLDIIPVIFQLSTSTSFQCSLIAVKLDIHNCILCRDSVFWILGSKALFLMFVVGTFENKAVGSKNLFQLRASAVLSWLKFSRTLARLWHDLVSNVNFNLFQ